MDGVTSLLSGTFKFVEFAFKLSNVSSETRATQMLLTQIQADLDELRQLRYDDRLRLDTKTRKRIDAQIQRTTETIAQVAEPIESIRVNKMIKGTVHPYQRFTWVIRDADTCRMWKDNLQMQQASVLQRKLELQSRLGISPRERITSRHDDTGHKAESDNEASGPNYDLGETLTDELFQDWLGEERTSRARLRAREAETNRHSSSDSAWLRLQVQERSEEDARRRSRSSDSRLL